MKYENRNKLFINGVWQEGSSKNKYSNKNPFDEETLQR
jgi:hypothetical protein